jgi:ATP-dependent exoDNAse (exonuclease V) beta subunit
MPEAVRRRVLDPQTSFLVQAPAGSGKTELLTQRFLALLGRVEQPEAVVAITFTKKAAGEMRARLLHALEMALGPKPEEDHKRQTWTLAEAVNRRRWDLIENPARLRIQTFDSFCRSLTEQMPWLSRLGAPPQIAEDTARLHYLAALEAVCWLTSTISSAGSPKSWPKCSPGATSGCATCTSTAPGWNAPCAPSRTATSPNSRPPRPAVS